MTFPNVAVILVNFNTASDTLACVQSLSKSTIQPFIVIVDNASNNKDVEFIAGQYEQLHIIYNSANLGFGKANNIGIAWIKEHLKADYIFLLNNDTLVEEATIEKLIEAFRNDEKIVVTTCKTVYEYNNNIVWYGGGFINMKKGKIKIRDWNQPASAEGANKSGFVTFVSGCAMMFQAEYLYRLGGFDERYFMYVEDMELCLRITNLGYKMWYTSETTIIHKVHGSSNRTEKKYAALHPKNPKLDFYIYHATKNLLLTMYQHTKGWSWLCFLSYYSVWSSYKLSLFVKHGRFKAIGSFGKALKDFYREKAKN